MKYCPECGTKCSKGKFCYECGSALENEGAKNNTAEISFDIEGMGSDSLDYLEGLAGECGAAEERDLLAFFEYEKHQSGKYKISALKHPDEMIVVVPAVVEAIGDGAFEGSEVIEITLPEGLIKIGKRAFANCKDLEKINFPSTLRIVADEAFCGCSVLDAEPPKDARIGKDAFKDTARYIRELEEQKKREAEEKAKAEREQREAEERAKAERKRREAEAKAEAEARAKAERKQREAEERAEAERKQREEEEKALRAKYEIDGEVIVRCLVDEPCMIIPEGVTKIKNTAFRGCKSLVDISIPSSVSDLGTSLNNKKLVNVTLAQGIERISDRAFAGCRQLKSINIPSSVTSIGEGAFEGCEALESITVPGSVTRIGVCAFSGCASLETVNIPDGVKALEGGTFNGCYSLVSIKLPNSVESIGSDAFHLCRSLKSVNIPEGVKWIGSGTFCGCGSLVYIKIPDSVKSIGRSAFEGCAGLKSITVPSGVVTIYPRTFYGCYRLAEVRLPNSVSIICEGAFEYCGGLKKVYIPENLRRKFSISLGNPKPKVEYIYI